MHPELEAVWAGFADPPDEARPRAWWHWMDGNVDPEGVRLDLEWLHAAGVRGVQMFDGGMGTPLVVPEKVAFGSPQWQRALRLARETARDLGLARVLVNGVDCGIVWTAPFEADVTGALRPGPNTVVVEVANAWMNRLIAEARNPTGEIFAPVAEVYEPHAEIRPAGLAGPVVLRAYPS